MNKYDYSESENRIFPYKTDNGVRVRSKDAKRLDAIIDRLGVLEEEMTALEKESQSIIDPYNDVERERYKQRCIKKEQRAKERRKKKAEAEAVKRQAQHERNRKAGAAYKEVKENGGDLDAVLREYFDVFERAKRKRK